jgi:serine/threonine protein kinase
MPDNVARIGIVWRKEGDGSTLEDYLQGGRDLYKAVVIPAESKGCVAKSELCRGIMAQLLLALLQMQEKGIMHRDIKPSNTLVVPGDAKVRVPQFFRGDFSLTKNLPLGSRVRAPCLARSIIMLQLEHPRICAQALLRL